MKKKLTLLIALSITLIFVAIFGSPVTAASNQQIPAEVTEEQPTEEPPQPLTEVIEPAPIEEEIPLEITSTTEYELPPSYIDTSFKSWMPWTAITNRGSAAYKQQQEAYTDENGLRKIGEDYCVAMGTYYSSTIGERFKITMSTGNTFTVIISDIKANRHTDKTNKYTMANHCMMEFLIDKTCLNSKVQTSGNIGSLELFSGTFVKVEKIS